MRTSVYNTHDVSLCLSRMYITVFTSSQSGGCNTNKETISELKVMWSIDDKEAPKAFIAAQEQDFLRHWKRINSCDKSRYKLSLNSILSICSKSSIFITVTCWSRFSVYWLSMKHLHIPITDWPLVTIILIWWAKHSLLSGPIMLEFTQCHFETFMAN